jgi:tRNA modification GTPase
MRENHTEHTIAAVSTARGTAAISLIRVSGSRAADICDTLFRGASPLPCPRTLVHGAIVDPATGQTVDRVLAAFFASPNSYTGEDMLEIHTHGGNYVTNRVFQLVVDSGARPAYPGEFTLRAFANAKLDLTQAEAVLDVIHARNEQFLSAAQRNLSGYFGNKIQAIRESIVNLLASIEVVFEYPDEAVPDVPHNVINDSLNQALASIETLLKSYKPESMVNRGLKIALLGRPNVGKSSIMNRVLGFERSIIHESPGTTRDLVGEWTDHLGCDILLMDTAGITESENPVEAEGVKRTKTFIEQEADEILIVFDGSQPLQHSDFQLIDYVLASLANEKQVTAVINKCDLPSLIDREQLKTRLGDCIETSALSGHGIPDLQNHIKISAQQALSSVSDVLFSNLRHKILLDGAKKSLTEALSALGSVPQDILCIDIRESADCLGEITGHKVSDDILNNIFNNFCVGK